MDGRILDDDPASGTKPLKSARELDATSNRAKTGTGSPNTGPKMAGNSQRAVKRITMNKTEVVRSHWGKVRSRKLRIADFSPLATMIESFGNSSVENTIVICCATAAICQPS